MESERIDHKQITISFDANSKIDRNTENRKNFGNVVFSKVYHELQLDWFFNNKQRHEKFEFNSNSIMKVLLFSRLLYPCSKKLRLRLKIDSLIRKTDLIYYDVTNYYFEIDHQDDFQKKALLKNITLTQLYKWAWRLP